MKKFNLLAAMVFVAGGVFAQTWSLDKAHSKLGFKVTHLLISEVEGSFKNFDATITSSKEDFSDAVIELSADVASVNTDNENRDKHLQSPDFFDAAKFAKLTFKSTSFKKAEGKNYKVIGDLTMHGVTKSVELTVTLNGTATNGRKQTVAGFKATGVVKRSDFSVGGANPAVSDEITLNANAEFVKG
jgi:polyisoprenoid-binding protein YceI